MREGGIPEFHFISCSGLLTMYSNLAGGLRQGVDLIFLQG
jgi:hypothetical protein